MWPKDYIRVVYKINTLGGVDIRVSRNVYKIQLNLNSVFTSKNKILIPFNNSKLFTFESFWSHEQRRSWRVRVCYGERRNVDTPDQFPQRKTT